MSDSLVEKGAVLGQAVSKNRSGGRSGDRSADHGSIQDAPDGLRRDMTTRQMVLMAAGGSIGAGLLVASGQALNAGGPASLVLNFLICGTMVGFTMAALGEMATSYPVAGAFYDYAVRFIGSQWGFAMGWNFCLNWLVVLPFELTAVVAQMQYWRPNLQAWIVILPVLLFLTSTSFMGVRWFGELEHWLGLCKAVCIATFICFALVATSAGIPGDDRGALAGRHWQEAAFRNGFQGFLSVFRTAGMAFGGTELLGLTVAECKRPHRIMPMATKVVFFRLLVFYILSLLMLAFVLSATDPHLASVGHGARYSPFVLAANRAGLSKLGHFFNATVVAALISMANVSTFSSSRALHALCAKGMGPELFSRLRNGNPIYALIMAFIVATTAFVTCAPNGEQLFDWLLSLSATSNYMTWASICFSHIRMRKAMRVQGRSTCELIWRSPFGTCGSYLAMMVCAVGIVSQIVMSAWPISQAHEAKTVVRDILGIVLVTFLFVGYTLYCRFCKGETGLLVPLGSVDLWTGMRDVYFARRADAVAHHDKVEQRRALGWQTDWSWHQKLLFHLKRATRSTRPDKTEVRRAEAGGSTPAC